MFFTFLVVLVVVSVLNIFSSHLMAIMNNVSVWWHVVGAASIVLILIFVPDQHQSFSYVFTERFNNSGLQRRQHHAASRFWFAVVPFGFLLTQYTITGFDACAHLSEETSSASMAAAKGIWRSIFYSAIGGYILLLCVRVRRPERRGRVAGQRRGRCRWRGLHLHRVARHELGRVRCCSSPRRPRSSARPRA